ncbi:hypothetical protein K1719_045750 [Acacia pycnantha]|nr:hypothetical protein K1719_045750 [Acacia pycnantha]
MRDGAVTNHEMVVAELINDRSWNINLLLGTTDPQNLSIVQNIPLSHAGRTDKLNWAAVKDGIYNVRWGMEQCYKLRRKKEYLSVLACFYFSISKLKALANSLEAECASKN